ncbi:matrix metalloproteinase-25 [Mantella aurantiaca]
MMKRPRCSLPDVVLSSGTQRIRRKRFALTGTVWQKKDLTWKVESFPVSLTQDITRTLMRSALEVWSREAPLTFSQTQGEADIRVGFVGGSHGDGYPFDGPGGTLGHAFFPGVGPIAGDAHMDADEEWTYNTDQGTDVFAVAVHEFGHALGLSHSSAEKAIMKPYYQGTLGDHRYYRLPADDIDGIQALYGRRDSAPRPPPPRPTQHPIPPRGPTYQPRPPFLDRCSTHFDAIASIRGEVFFFKNKFFWRMQASRNLVSLNPAHLHHFWHGLPHDLPRLDAVYERQNDSKIVFIAGNNFWVFKDTMVERGYPRPLSEFGLNTNGIDGAFIWKHNKKAYFFRHDRFWRYDEKLGRMDGGYPKDISLWEGLPPEIDDVISWVDDDGVRRHVIGDDGVRRHVIGDDGVRRHVIGDDGVRRHVIGDDGVRRHVIGDDGVRRHVIGDDGVRRHVIGDDGVRRHVIGDDGVRRHVIGDDGGRRHVIGDDGVRRHVIGDDGVRRHVIGDDGVRRHVIGDDGVRRHVIGDDVVRRHVMEMME